MDKKLVPLLLRGILSSTAILIVSYFILYESRVTWPPYIASICIVISILITAFLTKTDSLTQSIWLGVGVGTLTGIVCFLYGIFAYYPGDVEIAGQTPEVVLGFIFIFSMIFTAMLIFSCTTGTIASYFIRKRIRKIREELKNE